MTALAISEATARLAEALSEYQEIDSALDGVQCSADLRHWTAGRARAAKEVAEAFADATADRNPCREATIKAATFSLLSRDGWVERAAAEIGAEVRS